METNQKWTNNNNSYWNEIAKKYTDSYNDGWSLLENEFIAKKLNFVSRLQGFKILDLGCGTGLGYLLCSTSNPNIEYTGVDISLEMLNLLKEKYPNIESCNSTMSNLSNFSSCKFNGAISIFTAFSYTDNKENTISEISRVLKPEGNILISVISRFSLRRIMKLQFARKEKYKTRGIETDGFSYSWVFSKSDIKILLSNDFENIEIIGYNAFGGIPFLSKRTKLWNLNILISKIFPNLSHELIITANKKREGNV